MRERVCLSTVSIRVYMTFAATRGPQGTYARSSASGRPGPRPRLPCSFRSVATAVRVRKTSRSARSTCAEGSASRILANSLDGPVHTGSVSDSEVAPSRPSMPPSSEFMSAVTQRHRPFPPELGNQASLGFAVARPYIRSTISSSRSSSLLFSRNSEYAICAPCISES